MRADEIKPILDRANFIFDINQTVEPTESMFFIFEHNQKSVEFAFELLPETPIVTFPSSGFSIEGKTMLEYASSIGCKAFAIECGQKGFSNILSENMLILIKNLIKKTTYRKAKEINKSIIITHLVETIKNEEGSYLAPNLKNHMKVLQGEVIGFRKNGQEITVNQDGRLYFPRYGNLACIKSSPVLCDIGKEIDYKNI